MRDRGREGSPRLSRESGRTGGGLARTRSAVVLLPVRRIDERNPPARTDSTANNVRQRRNIRRFFCVSSSSPATRSAARTLKRRRIRHGISTHGFTPISGPSFLWAPVHSLVRPGTRTRYSYLFLFGSIAASPRPAPPALPSFPSSVHDATRHRLRLSSGALPPCREASKCRVPSLMECAIYILRNTMVRSMHLASTASTTDSIDHLTIA